MGEPAFFNTPTRRYDNFSGTSTSKVCAPAMKFDQPDRDVLSGDKDTKREETRSNLNTSLTCPRRHASSRCCSESNELNGYARMSSRFHRHISAKYDPRYEFVCVAEQSYATRTLRFVSTSRRQHETSIHP